MNSSYAFFFLLVLSKITPVRSHPAHPIPPANHSNAPSPTSTPQANSSPSNHYGFLPCDAVSYRIWDFCRNNRGPRIFVPRSRDCPHNFAVSFHFVNHSIVRFLSFLTTDALGEIHRATSPRQFYPTRRTNIPILVHQEAIRTDYVRRATDPGGPPTKRAVGNDECFAMLHDRLSF